MNFIKTLRELDKDNVAEAGGKGASLGEMTQAGIPVPSGFVILSRAFDRFVAESDINTEIDSVLHSVDNREIHTVDDASEKIKALILAAEMPADITREIKSNFQLLDSKFVAVRSSATAEDSASAAWAGQLESYLNTTGKGLLENVKKCWASLFTPRAIFYRFEKFGKETHLQKISVAVVVQKMVESEMSGIIFSVHPVTQDYNQLIIEAALGLGEAIVSGQITPDSYVVEKEPRRILDKNVVTQTRGMYRGGWKDIPEAVGEKQVLSDSQILELSDLVLKIESHYNFPVDIEWAFESGKFYIVQSRPITTLSEKKPSQNLPDPKDYVRMFAGQSFVYLLTDIFLKFYNKWGVLSIQDKENWMSFLPKTSQAKTLAEGKELYTSKAKYQGYNKKFHDYIKSSTKYFESVLKQEEINAQDVERFLSLVSEHFSYYSKTEFFYTDALDLNKMASTVQEFDKLKLDGRAYLNRLIFEEEKGFLRQLTKKLAKQIGMSENDLLHYGVDELTTLIRDGEKLSHKTFAERNVFFASQDLTLFGEESKTLVDSFLSPYRQVSSVIKGTIANRGVVKGKARVLLPDFKNFDKIAKMVDAMEKGEILIAETTSPELMPACKKAGAIVTNQGGMLSHAAIVSRELGIPCIIGTDKDVILNIKTGDMVEVDADNGVVRILE